MLSKCALALTIALSTSLLANPPAAQRPQPAKTTPTRATTLKEPSAPEPSASLKPLLSAPEKRIEKREYAEALTALVAALQAAQDVQDPVGEARAHTLRAQALEGLNQNEAARVAWRTASTLWAQAQYVPGQAEALANTGRLSLRTDFEEANRLINDAIRLARAETLRPLQTIEALNRVATQALANRQNDVVRTLAQATLPLAEKHAPQSLTHAQSLYLRGAIALKDGSLTEAKQMQEQALEIRKKESANPLEIAESLSSLGSVALDMNDLEKAESLFRRALKIRQTKAPNSLLVASSTMNIAKLIWKRVTNENMKDVQDVPVVEKYYYRALHIRNRLAPGSHLVAEILSALGNLGYAHNGDREEANDFHQQALAIWEKLDPNSLEVASSLNSLAYDLRDYPKAERYYLRALAIAEKRAPESLLMETVLSNLGSTYLQLKQPQKARDYYLRSIAMLETKRASISGSEARRLWSENYTERIHGLIEAYRLMGETANAFNALELVRGRSFTESLFERKTARLAKSTPPSLLAEHDQINADRSRVLSQRQNLDPNEPKDLLKYDKNDEALRELNAKQRDLEEKIRRASPLYASLKYPKPLDLKAIQNILDPGTLLLEYAIAKEKTYLFAVTKTSIKKYIIETYYAYLPNFVKEFLDSLVNDNAPRNPQIAIKLYNLLLRPAQAEIDKAERLLFCPEKSLWKLPFCALIDNNDPKNPHYLVESKPIHYTVSMNVYASLIHNRTRPRKANSALIAFGDPAYAPTPQRSASRKTSKTVLAQLPASSKRLLLGGHSFESRAVTGKSVHDIKDNFQGNATVYVGKQATPRAVFKAASGARILHFACHAWLDGRDPLASFIALSPNKSGEQFGMLSAYDVLEKLHLDADLVTLAACETGVGAESETEGVIGLTHAFSYAGAQSVLMSLWAIDANSSSLLLSGTTSLKARTKQRNRAHSFYEAIQAKMSKDQALRLAQIELLRGANSEYRDPRHWAAFSLQGDWK